IGNQYGGSTRFTPSPRSSYEPIGPSSTPSYRPHTYSTESRPTPSFDISGPSRQLGNALSGLMSHRQEERGQRQENARVMLNTWLARPKSRTPDYPTKHVDLPNGYSFNPGIAPGAIRPGAVEVTRAARVMQKQAEAVAHAAPHVHAGQEINVTRDV